MLTRPQFRTDNLAPSIAALMAATAARRWLVVLPDDATTEDGAPVGCHTFYLNTRNEADKLASRHVGAVVFPPVNDAA